MFNSQKVDSDGLSRYDKAALIVMAYDHRFAIALIGLSGNEGVTLYRRNFRGYFPPGRLRA